VISKLVERARQADSSWKRNGEVVNRKAMWGYKVLRILNRTFDIAC
jgi:hypothetical protein